MASTNRLTRVLGLFAACLVSVSCGDNLFTSPYETPQLDRSAVSLVAGTKTKLRVSNGDGTTPAQTTWSSSKPEVATVDQDGTVEGIGDGVAIITAAVANGNQSGRAQAKVSVRHTVVQLAVAPAELLLSVGGSGQAAVEAQDAKGRVVRNVDADWSSSHPAVASVDSSGKVRGLAPGTATITASADGLTASLSATVTAASTEPAARIVITPGSDTITSLGGEQQLSAVVRDAAGGVVNSEVKWTSAHPAVAEVNGDGLVTSKTVGTALIIATAAAVADTAEIRVTQVPADLTLTMSSISLRPNSTQQLGATVVDAAGTPVAGSSVQWSSADRGVATVSSSGLVTAVADGSTIVRATAAALTAEVSVSVSEAQVSSIAELPRVWVNTDWVAPTGRTIFVAAGGDLQAAINSAARGDVVELQAGATFTGSFTLPAKSGSGWITIRSRGTLPAPGTRMRPENAGNLAKLVSDIPNERVVTVESGASHYRIVGLEMTIDRSVSFTNAILDIRNGSSHIIVDRSYIHGRDDLDLQRCVMLHAEHGAVIDSWLSKCHYKGQDSQAIIAWSTNGPLKIVNNHLEGAGENVMFGGATPAPNTLPSDIEIRGNHFYKPASWLRSDGSSLWTVKNLFEIKFARRVLLEGNIFDGNWKDGQDGHAFNIKRSELGSGDRVEDITIRYNVLRNSTNGLKIVAPAERVHVHNNVIYGIEDRLFTLLGPDDLRLEYNTALHGGNIITSTSGIERFVAKGNIWGSEGGYGVKGGGAEGTSTLDADFPGWVYEQNGHIGRTASRYPSGNSFVDNLSAARFTSVSAGDLRLRSDSPFAGLGADIDRVMTLTAGVR